MKQLLNIVYRTASYAMFSATLIYALAFLANTWVPWPMDAVPAVTPARALLTNLLLATLLTTQHCLLSPTPKLRWWSEFVGTKHQVPICMLVSSICMLIVLYLWEPVGRLVWNLEADLVVFLLHATYLAGCIIVLVNMAFMTRYRTHELHEAWAPYLDRLPGNPDNLLRRMLRNPLYAGWLLLVWSTPAMTVSHLVLSLVITTAVLIAVLNQNGTPRPPVLMAQGRWDIHVGPVPDDIQ